jgi:glycosidase
MKQLAYIILLFLLAISCNPKETGGQEGIMVHTSLSVSIPASRVNIGPTGVVNWNEDDKIYIFTDTDEEDDQVGYCFYITEIRGGKNASFSGSVLDNPNRSKIYALYPYDNAHVSVHRLLKSSSGNFSTGGFGRLDSSSNFLVCIHETQDATKSEHYTMMCGSSSVMGSDFSKAQVSFRYLTLIWDVSISNPFNKKISAVSMKASDTVFPTQCTLDLSNPEAAPQPIHWTDSISVKFLQGQSSASVSARFILLPMPACSGESIDVRVHFEDGSYELFHLSGSSSPTEAGARYTNSLALGSGEYHDCEQENYFYDKPFNGVPSLNDMKIYEASPRIFAASGSLQAIRSRLDKIAALNINVLWIMPIFEGSKVRLPSGSPYSAKSFEQIDSEYGTLNDLRELVRDAHGKGIAVILDFITNHTGADCEWVSTHQPWYMETYDSNYTDAALFDWNNVELQDEIIRIMKYWIRVANIDGYRCDTAMPTRSNGVSLAFWGRANTELKALQPGRQVIMLAEAANPICLNYGFDLNYGWHFCDALMGAFNGSMTIANLFNVNTDEWNGPASNAGKSRMRYSTNHDKNAPASLHSIYGSQEGADAAFVIALTMGGVPMIYGSQEIGYSNRVSFFKGVAPVMDWNINPEVFSRYCSFMKLADHLVLRKGSISQIANDNVVSFVRKHDSKEVLVLVNIRNSTSSFTLPPPYSGASYKNLLNGENQTITSFSLPAYGYLVLEKQ